MANMDFIAELYVVGKSGDGEEKENGRAIVQVVDIDDDGVQIGFTGTEKKDRVFIRFQLHELLKAVHEYNKVD